MTSKVDLNPDEREWNTDTFNEWARLACLFHSYKGKELLRTVSSPEIATWQWRVLESIETRSHAQESISVKVRRWVFLWRKAYPMKIQTDEFWRELSLGSKREQTTFYTQISVRRTDVFSEKTRDFVHIRSSLFLSLSWKHLVNHLSIKQNLLV